MDSSDDEDVGGVRLLASVFGEDDNVESSDDLTPAERGKMPVQQDAESLRTRAPRDAPVFITS